MLLHRLLQQGSLLHRVQSFWHSLPPECHKPCEETCSSMGSFSTGHQVLLGACSTESQPPLRHLLLWCGFLPWAAGRSLHLCEWAIHQWAAGAQQHHHGLHGMQGNLSCGAWSTSSFSFFSDLGVCRVDSFTFSRSFSGCSSICPISFFGFPSSVRCHHL